MRTITSSVGKGGVNRSQDVKTVQALLNDNLLLLPLSKPMAVTGLPDIALYRAIEDYQRCVLKMSLPDGRVDPHGRTLRALNGAAKEPAWIAIARAEKGTREIRGIAKNSPRILEYIASFPYLKAIWHDEKKRDYRLGNADETPWCACFVNWCLIKAGKPAGPSARARDWMKYGTKLDVPRVGAICVVYRTPKAVSSGVTSSGYHVAFWTAGAGSSLTLLGGNQTAKDKTTEEVNEKSSSKYWTVQAYRWPI